MFRAGPQPRNVSERRMSERLSEALSERMSDECQKECQKICQKESEAHVNKMSERMSEYEKVCLSESMRITRKNDGGFACFEMPVHGLKVDDNPHLTTTTRHVMVGIARSQVIVVFFFNPVV